jgi:hypothetical protein
MAEQPVSSDGQTENPKIVLDQDTQRWIEQVACTAVAHIEVLAERRVQMNRLALDDLQKRAVLNQARIPLARSLIDLIQAMINVNTSLSPVFEPLRRLQAECEQPIIAAGEAPRGP